MDQFGPLVGFSISLVLLCGALIVFCLFLWILVPFSLFGMRKQIDRQLEVLLRIERELQASRAKAAPSVVSAPPDPS